MNNFFLTNYTEETFLDKIKNNLRTCKAFYFSVSFIKKAGLVLMLNDIEAALARGAKGQIVTSTYQNFTDIESLKAFRRLADKYENFDCHLDYESFIDEKTYSTIGYHSKGYLFEFADGFETIIGSSNITRYALLKNIEWDLVTKDEKIFCEVKSEFEKMWEKTHDLDPEIINLYSNKLNFAIERWDMDYDLDSADIKPNFMQRKALKELNRFRAVGTSRALIVAAAGSGKTYLAAFDAYNFNPQKLLYVVHEGSILKKSLETFQSVFGGEKSYGIFGTGQKDLGSDFLFATNVSMANNLELFDKEEFDYIIIDECHHAAAETYKRIIEYFEPEFLIGLTATPERMDNQDVFELFDDNVPYELRLRDAIINDLVVPFNYFGIRDSMVDYGLSAREEYKMISQLATEEHCEFIHEQIEKHRESNQKLKALAFCRTVQHARMMAEAMGEFYKTAYLSGKNNVGERIRAYNDLQNDKSDLEILFTVDILNEGVDIPGVNMVLFLRPTESSTIFIQQLGRGLRKCDNKERVIVLDFVGNNYRRSVQIAFALGSLAKNFVLEKRLLQSMVSDNFKALGLSSYGVKIEIDDLAKEELSQWIENENFNALKYIKQDFFNFKQYINADTYPKHMDYLNNDCAPELIRFLNSKVEGKKSDAYYCFLKGIGEENLPIFNDGQVEFIKYISKMLPLVRKYEYIIIRHVIEGTSSLEEIRFSLKSNIKDFKEAELKHALTFMAESGFFTLNGDDISVNVDLSSELIEYIEDLIEYGLTQHYITYGDSSDYKLWHRYRIDQVQLKRCINPGYTSVGTYYGEEKDVYIFASLKKDLPEDSKLNYKDKYLEPSLFQWESKNNLSDAERAKLLNSKKAYVFIRKTSDEGGIVQPFIYAGTGHLSNPRPQKENRSLLFDIVMDCPLPDYLQYDFGLTTEYIEVEKEA